VKPQASQFNKPFVGFSARLYDMVVVLASSERGAESNEQSAENWTDGAAESVSGDYCGDDKPSASA
jgi:hypothetical protein